MSVQDKVMALARSQIGVREFPMGSNCVKYNNEYYGLEVRGGAYPWCCVFQWWLFRQAGASQLFYGGGKTASCTALYRYYEKQGRAVAREDIRPGDLVFFVFDGGKSGGMNHVGLCESVERGWVTTIDGNTGDDEANGGTVARKRRALQYVGGAARPEYPEEGEKAGMRLYRYVEEMPDWAKAATVKAISQGYVKMDETGAAGVWESNLQTLVWLDRAGLLDRPAVR